MRFTVAVALGLLVGSALVALSRLGGASGGRSSQVAWPRWTALALGIAAATVFALMIAGRFGSPVLAISGIALPLAALIFGVARVVSGDRRWPSWLGLALALAPVLFWVAFAVGEVVGPQH